MLRNYSFPHLTLIDALHGRRLAAQTSGGCYCDEAELRRRARALILASKRNPEAPTLSGAPLLNSRIGPYFLVRHLGSGGIGAVYLVERIVGGTIQRAALKVLSLHAASAFFVERFAREQHILASLDHPNITRMLDAGLNESGEP
jgi:serine/threonine protein kinase